MSRDPTAPDFQLNGPTIFSLLLQQAVWLTMYFWGCTIRLHFRDAFVDHTVIVCQIRAYERVHLMERPRKGDDLQLRFVSGQVVHNAQQVARENGLPIIFKSYFWKQNCQKHMFGDSFGFKLLLLQFWLETCLNLTKICWKMFANIIGDYSEMDQKLRKIIPQYDWGLVWTRR